MILNWIFGEWTFHWILLCMNFVDDITFKRITAPPSRKFWDPINIYFVMNRLCTLRIHGLSQPQTMKPSYICPKKTHCGEKDSLILSTAIWWTIWLYKLYCFEAHPLWINNPTVEIWYCLQLVKCLNFALRSLTDRLF